MHNIDFSLLHINNWLMYIFVRLIINIEEIKNRVVGVKRDREWIAAELLIYSQ